MFLYINICIYSGLNKPLHKGKKSAWGHVDGWRLWSQAFCVTSNYITVINKWQQSEQVCWTRQIAWAAASVHHPVNSFSFTGPKPRFTPTDFLIFSHSIREFRDTAQSFQVWGQVFKSTPLHVQYYCIVMIKTQCLLLCRLALISSLLKGPDPQPSLPTPARSLLRGGRRRRERRRRWQWGTLTHSRVPGHPVLQCV